MPPQFISYHRDTVQHAFPKIPQTDRVEKPDPNAEIMARHEAGGTVASLAEAYGISEQRVNQIVRSEGCIMQKLERIHYLTPQEEYSLEIEQACN
jgi:predicted transcriptional regulator